MATATVGKKTVTRTVEVEEAVLTLELTPQEERNLRRVLAVVQALDTSQWESDLQKDCLEELEKAKVFVGDLWQTLMYANVDGEDYPSVVRTSWGD